MKLNLESGNQNLSANLIKPENFKQSLPALIFIHGWKSNQEGNIKRATAISKLGFICLTIDLRGHGESEGSIEEFSVKDHLEDVKTAYKYLVENSQVNPEKIGIIGSSYGGNLAAIATNFLKFEWLVLRVPALYVDKYFDTPTESLIGKDEEGEAFKSTKATIETSMALKGVNNFPGDILIIESEKDEIIPHPVIENYLMFIEDKRKLTYEIIKNAFHALETEEQEKEYIEILKNWLSQKSKELEIEV